ncbi:MAG: hypothetical protein WAW23_00760, partial [Candidatus Methanoperedens sp.]
MPGFGGLLGLRVPACGSGGDWDAGGRVGYSSCGPRNRSPLKWMRCVGESAIQTSVSQEMSSRYLIIVR